MRALVRPVAILTSSAISRGHAFIGAVLVVLAFIGVGGWFGYSDRWLAILSASLSIVTFLLVFLLQYRESRDTAAIQLKLNELLRAVDGAREREFADLEHLAAEAQETVSRELSSARAEVAFGRSPGVSTPGQSQVAARPGMAK